MTLNSIQDINKQIELLNKKKTELLEVEGFTITKPIECKTYKEAKCPKGFRLPKQWELFKIFGEDKTNVLRKQKNIGFYWSSTKWENYSKGLFLDWGLDVGSGAVGLAGSGSGGRVVFVKEIVK